ncbi:hypothetical protein TWF694_007333 [Orbilia ellipsospora]|uniref:C2H2-type domain-containing protein n=1 Tax=Orbilia ellipsospora TaxID=2528407 RepID=A0AAV9XIX0_9PEZI
MSKRPRRDSDTVEPPTITDYPSPSPTPPPPPSLPLPPAKYTRSSHSPTGTNTTMSTQTQTQTITCTLPNCPHREHNSIESFETHYSKHHTNRCHDCLKNFPTARILECHIRENHDMFAVLAQEKGEKIYACFVEDCDKICVSFGKRRAHLVDKHYYHKNFNFYIVNDGIDRATTLLTTSPPRKSRTRVRRVSESSFTAAASASGEVGTDGVKVASGNMDIDTPTPSSPTARRSNRQAGNSNPYRKHMRSASESQVGSGKEVKVEAATDVDMKGGDTNGNLNTKEEEDAEMMDLTARMGAVRFVPPSVVRFGRRGGGGSGFSKN